MVLLNSLVSDDSRPRSASDLGAVPAMGRPSNSVLEGGGLISRSTSVARNCSSSSFVWAFSSTLCLAGRGQTDQMHRAVRHLGIERFETDQE